MESTSGLNRPAPTEGGEQSERRRTGETGDGISVQRLSRRFRQAYGTTAKRFRAEHRAQRALRALPGWPGTLGGLAAETGFADQAHLTRAVVSLTGWTPGQLRVKWIQDRSRVAG